MRQFPHVGARNTALRKGEGGRSGLAHDPATSHTNFCLHKYVEAIDMNEKMRGLGLSRRKVSSLTVGPNLRSHSLFGPRDEMGAPTQPVVTTRDLLIQSLAKSLPSVTRDLADYCAKEKNFKWKQGTYHYIHFKS
ncbi:hypothetical protein J6590_069204 [Homalodisca vitripennis]|nr:hypothetical protein J6590_069204 [Homalodisca vitripennis]